MSFGFPARFTETRIYHLQEPELARIAKEAFEELGWPYEIESRTEFRARTPLMFLGSWGQRLSLQILLDGEITIESRSIWPGFDSGVNKRNVQMLFSRFEHAERMYRLVETPQEAPLAFDEDGLSPVERLLSQSKND
jgi:hypothetical protein